jgi:hypothetical protein
MSERKMADQIRYALEDFKKTQTDPDLCNQHIYRAIEVTSRFNMAVNVYGVDFVGHFGADEKRKIEQAQTCAINAYNLL